MNMIRNGLQHSVERSEHFDSPRKSRSRYQRSGLSSVQCSPTKHLKLSQSEDQFLDLATETEYISKFGNKFQNFGLNPDPYSNQEVHTPKQPLYRV